VLSSFPPLPGDSIVKRNLSDHVATLARTLKTQNCNTLFLYGGRGIFDGMRSFAVRNGFDRFIEQKDFPHPSFTTIWGVCDEDLYKRGIEELRALHQKGSPFFVTMLSVSNHKPYTYPAGRIAEDPNQHSRSNAVKYTDWALGQFFEMAKKEDFYKDTVFAVVADHGARIYGSQEIPIYSYRIPLLIVGGGVPQHQRPAMLGSSLDVGPTLLGFLGRAYTSIFFGRDLFKIPPTGGWAVMNHNRDIGLYKNGRMVVLGLNKKVSYYLMDPITKDLKLVNSPTPEDMDLEKDAAAIFQVADELYTSSRYHVD
jgi:phosphoglycerol transferase MdoB-like AlkP superfamily enzyme